MSSLTGAYGATAAQLNEVYWAVEHMTNLEDQDRNLVIEMAQAMLIDLIQTGGFKPMADYVRRYCDVAESAEEAEQITAYIVGDD